MATCPQGHSNADDVRFCEKCGLQLAPPPAVVGQVPQTVQPGMLAPVARKRKPWLIPVFIVGVLVLAGGGFLVFRKAVPNTTTVPITVTIYGETECSSYGLGLGYGDVPGSLMTVRADGIPVGVATLEEYGEFDGVGCVFQASVSDVPMDAAIYSMETGRRGEISSTRSEMEANGWSFDATLGS